MALTWHIVEDRSPLPSRYSVAAALLMTALYDAHAPVSTRIGFAHLPYRFDTDRYPDGCQHVAAHGGLLPSGMVHFERLTGSTAPQAIELKSLLTAGNAPAQWPLIGQYLTGWRPAAGAGTQGDVVTGVASEATDVATDIVIPIHPGVTLPVVDADALAALCAQNGIPYRLYRTYGVSRADVSESLPHTLPIVNDAAAGIWLCREDDGWQSAYMSDAFGRWTSAPHLVDGTDRVGARDGPPRHGVNCVNRAADVDTLALTRSIHIALIGTDTVQREQYPATMAALADAADALHLTLRVDCIDPTVLMSHEWTVDRRLHGYHGVLLPGGADMRRVPGMIAACKTAWRDDVPTLGLCLGMQAMVTEAVQRRIGTKDATLPEFDAKTSLPSFVPIERYRRETQSTDDAKTKAKAKAESKTLSVSRHGASTQAHSVAGPTDFHRLGVHALRVKKAKRAFAWMRHSSAIHCNHRYMMNPVVARKVLDAGLDFAAWGDSQPDTDGPPASGATRSARLPTKRIIDVIVADSRRFYVGYQGHPELMSRPDAPHPALLAFLRAAVKPAARGRPARPGKRRSMTRRSPLQKATRRRCRPMLR